MRILINKHEKFQNLFLLKNESNMKGEKIFQETKTRSNVFNSNSVTNNFCKILIFHAGLQIDFFVHRARAKESENGERVNSSAFPSAF